jgi:predicted lipoprotein with Yx(FWY)xxD motif
MTRSRSLTFLAGAAAVPLVALTVAGCGGGGSSSNASAASAKNTSARTATIGVARTGLGKILVDSRGRTIYLFKKDTGSKSTCFGECANDWPPVRVTGKPSVGNGATASMIGTTKRSDGKPQVTYNGHPLYLFKGDNASGDTNGQAITAFGAAWFAVSPAGSQVSGTGSTSSSNGY